MTEALQEITTNFSSDEFFEFYRGLSILKDICNDVDIVEGVIRQRSNDKSCIIEIDMTPLLQQGNLPITQIKQKLDLFKIFSGEEITVDMNESRYVLLDQYSSISFLNPNHDYIDNKFMDLDELNSMFTLSEENLILETTLTSEISERIKTITNSFNTSTLEVEFNGETAQIICSTQAADQKAIVKKDIVTNSNIDEKTTNLVSIPFVTDHDGDMILQMYNIKDNILINKFSSCVGGINYIIYSRSILISEDE